MSELAAGAPILLLSVDMPLALGELASGVPGVGLAALLSLDIPAGLSERVVSGVAAVPGVASVLGDPLYAGLELPLVLLGVSVDCAKAKPITPTTAAVEMADTKNFGAFIVCS